MSKHDDLLALAERCEKATAEQQRELLEAAYTAIFGHPPVHEYRQPDGQRVTAFLRMLDAEAFESAAMTLLPEGWRIDYYTDCDADGGRLCLLMVFAGELVAGSAATRALTYLAAILRALASQESPQ